MKTLGFSSGSRREEGHRIRHIVFEERSTLPVSAACIVASGVRDTLSALFGEPVTLKLYEPSIPTPSAWIAIGRDATIYRARMGNADAAVIVRPADASALAAAAFGEHAVRAAALSSLERTVLERTVQAIALQFGPICGSGTRESALEPLTDLHGFTTFFELQLVHPIRSRIGIALSRDPLPQAYPAVGLDELHDLLLELIVHADLGRHRAADIAALEPGTVLALPVGALRGALLVAGRMLALGECGVHGQHYALAIDRTPTGRDEPAA
ncbi:MAG: FliM/FliN family flagellar motor C-terminal domain-containing protein [Candidatus Aquilonibacter sp.]